jgi:hypothetical protein
MKQIIESNVTSSVVKGRIYDARQKYVDAWVELRENGKYDVVVELEPKAKS